MRTSPLIQISCLCLFLISAPVSAKDVRYVSDQLTIPMRSGTTINHKILKFLDSGSQVIVLDTAEEDAYFQVALPDDDKIGWVDASLLMKEPSAREQLLAVNKKNEDLRARQDELKKQIAELKVTEAKLMEVQNTLAELRKSAAQPILIAEENIKLKKSLDEEQSKNESLVAENIFLSDKNIRQWFLIGGGVSIGSLILGLLITRISWKRDRWA